MNAAIGQVAGQLEQLLENYARCGLDRIPRIAVDQLPPEVLAALEQADTADASQPQNLAIQQQNLASKQTPAPRAPSPNPAAAQTPSTTAAKTTSPKAVAVSTAAPQGDWSLPILDDAERTTRLGDLDLQVRQCRKCEDIISYRQQTVFGSGPVNPRICFVGEAPGADEDRQGEPFVGRAGQLLTKIIGAMKLKRDEVYILNALKCRPPQNRTPVPEEIEACRHFIEGQLDILQPEFIVCLGAVAARSLLRASGSIGSMRGKFLSYKQARVVVTYHPSYLLRNENAKRLVWDDMQMLMAEL